MSSDDSIYKLNPTVGCQNVRRSYRDMVPRCELLTIHLESPKLCLGLGPRPWAAPSQFRLKMSSRGPV